MKINKVLLILLLLVIFIAPTYLPALAQTPTPSPTIDTLWVSVNKIIESLRTIVLAAGTLVIIYAGIMYITGAFNPDNVGAAKTILTTTILGLIFMLLYPTIIDVFAKQGLIPPLEKSTTTTPEPNSFGGGSSGGGGAGADF